MTVASVFTDLEKIDSRDTLCRLISVLKAYVGNNAFTKEFFLKLAINSIKIRRKGFDIRKHTPNSISVERAETIFNIMVSKEYIEFSHMEQMGVINKNAVPRKLYKIGNLRYTECQQTSWYKNRERKEKYLQRESNINTKRCRALQQIYVMFGYSPFSYKMVTIAVDNIIKLANDKTLVISKVERLALDHMKSKLYSYDKESFREVWQSLIKNGYVLPHRIKTKDGYIQKTGLYKINPAFLKRCIVEMI